MKQLVICASLLLASMSGSLAQDADLARYASALKLAMEDNVDWNALSIADRGDLLARLALEDDGVTITRLVEAGFDPNTPTSRGSSALLVGLTAGRPNAVAALLDAGADPGLAYGARSAADLAEIMLPDPVAGMVLSYANEPAWSALVLAVLNGNSERIRDVGAAGVAADIADPSGQTALHVAAVLNRTEALTALLEIGASPDIRNNASATPLAAAVLTGARETALALIDAGADVHIQVDGLSPLALAISTGDSDLINALLQAGADPSRLGAAPELLVSAYGLPPDIDLPIPLDTPQGDPIDLMAAITSNTASAVRQALAEGADPNGVDGEIPPIVAAAAFAAGDIVRTLIDAGADPLGSAPNGITAFHSVLSRGDDLRLAIFPVLLSAVTSDTELSEALTAVGSEGRSAIVGLAGTPAPSGTLITRQILWEAIAARAPASLLHADADGLTPASAALLTGNDVALKIILRRPGADQVPDTAPVSLADLARRLKNWAILNLLDDRRVPPEDLTLSADEAKLAEFDATLNDWGFAGDASTLYERTQAFLGFHEKELLERAQAGADWLTRVETPDAAPNGVLDDLTDSSPNGWCRWRRIVWNVQDADAVNGIFGCFAGGSEWNANGIARIDRVGGTSETVLMGPDGWATIRAFP